MMEENWEKFSKKWLSVAFLFLMLLVASWFVYQRFQPDRVHYEKAMALVEEEYYQEAIEEFSQAILINPDYAEAYYQRGLVYIIENGYEDPAMSDFEKAIALKPKLATVSNEEYAYLNFIFGMRKKYFLPRDFKKAVEYFDCAIQINPNEYDAYRERALTLVYLEEYEKALTDFDFLIKQNVNVALAYGGKGYMYYQMGDYEKAVVYLSKAIELDPKLVDSYSSRALAYTEMGKYEKAISDFNYAISITPTPNFPDLSAYPAADLYYGRGRTYYRMDRYEQALSDFNQVIDLDENYTLAYFARAWTYEKLGDTQNAVKDFKRTLELCSGQEVCVEAQKFLDQLDKGQDDT